MTGEVQLPAGYRLLRHGEVDSTSDQAKRLAEAGAAHGAVVWAASQRKGRGRRGNAWQSPPGNLYASLLLRPERSPAKALQLSFVTALALADAIAAMVPPRAVVTCKWPNDVFLNHRKLAGLLLESSTGENGALDWLVIGLGVNIVTAPGDLARPATSLHGEGCAGLTAGYVLSAFCACFSARYDDWLARGFAPQREAWLGLAEGIDGPVTVNLEGETFGGRFVDIDGTGALIVETDGQGRRVVTSGEVFMS